MITSDIVFKDIIDKLVFLTGNEFISIRDFEKQLSVIRKNYEDAYTNYKNSKKTWPPSELFNNVIKEFYVPTDTLLEKTLLLRNEDEYPAGFGKLLDSNNYFEGIPLKEYNNIFNFLETFKRFLELEDLKKLRHYQINFFNKEALLEGEKSVKFSDIPTDWFKLKLFLISNERINILEQRVLQHRHIRDYVWEITKISNEFFLKKDIKEVSTIDTQVIFRNRLNSTWVIHVESLEKAVELRRIINELR